VLDVGVGNREPSRSSTRTDEPAITDLTKVLPPSTPTLVLVGSNDPTVVAELDALTLATAASLDVRTGVLWTEVPDGRAFLDHLLETFTDSRNQIRFAFAEPRATVDALVRRALLAADLDTLANAVERAHLIASPPAYQVRYQPIVRLSDRRVIGFESLIRAHAEGEVIDAEELIARATRGEWLHELDELGRSMALGGVGPWLGAGLLFLNVMAPNGVFDVAAVTATVERALELGLDADQIVLEAMERNRYTDLAAAAAQIDSLRDLGVRVAVDDVGDGFSSLRVLGAFKPDIVKVAGQLVAELPSLEAEATIRAIVGLAHQTGAWVVAENIETIQQADQLERLEVDWGQGNFLGLPASRTETDDQSADRRPVIARA
jgi:EAL domain-containing protein (putative c-di-GMP-specific phosphodiesterase class I)